MVSYDLYSLVNKEGKICYIQDIGWVNLMKSQKEEKSISHLQNWNLNFDIDLETLSGKKEEIT